jgi:hypothetical protein
MSKFLMFYFCCFFWWPIKSLASSPLEILERYNPGEAANVPLPETKATTVTVHLDKTVWAEKGFAGQLVVQDGTIASVSIWTEDVRLLPAEAQELFTALGRELEKQHGPATTFAVPNFEDGSVVKVETKIWVNETQILQLGTTIYPRRSSVSLFSAVAAPWLDGLGADTGEFFRRELPLKAGVLNSANEAAPNKKRKVFSPTRDRNSSSAKQSISPSQDEPAAEDNSIIWWRWAGAAFITIAVLFLLCRALFRR